MLEQAQNPTGSLPRREVIDGQQRLTTLQLMLKAAEHALADAEATAKGEQATMTAFARRQLGTLTVNDAYQPEERYQVWPTNEDREPYRAVLDSDAVTGPFGETRMAQAYRFFREAALRYLLSAAESEDLGTRAQR